MGKSEENQGDIDQQPKSADFINDLIGEEFKNFNPRREIYNVTFTFPKDSKESMTEYIKHNGKKHLVEMIVEEVSKCQDAEVK